MGGSGKHCLQDTDIKAAFLLLLLLLFPPSKVSMLQF